MRFVSIGAMTAVTLLACGPVDPGTNYNDNTDGHVPLTCGNGVLDDGEECDSVILSGATCSGLTGLPHGMVTCSAATCTYDISDCHNCGNGQLEGSEPCDGANLGGLTCESLGREGGTLACDPSCSEYDTSACSPCFVSGRSCSADLQHIVDCNGLEVDTCPGDEACLNGQCGADPCEAADAARSSYGCNYYVPKPDFIQPEGYGACYAVFIANTWNSPVFITVEKDNQPLGTSFIQIPQGQGQSITYTPYDAANGLPQGSVAIVFLSHQTPQMSIPNCPVPAAVNGEPGVSGTGIGTAFKITTDRPVVAYSILPYGGGSAAATAASLLLPTSAWDTNYIAVNAYEKSIAVSTAFPSLDIVAFEDNTQVTILPKVAIEGGGGVLGSPANQPVVYSLNAGQYIQISQTAELTGSPIQADKPIGVWGAASCLNVPASAYACDSAHQQIPPVRALGHRYAGVRYRNRQAAMGEETPPWRLVGAVDGTVLTWAPSNPAGAPTALNQGDLVEFNAAGPFVVESQDASHPFYVAQYMTGGDQFNGEGDPEFVNVVPMDQYLNRYIFFTDPTYSETSLVVVRTRSPATNDFVDVTLDCAGPLIGWQPLGELEYTRIDLVTGDFMNVGNCSNGRQEMHSEAPFGVTVWGWGGYSSFFTQYVSYAYPAGASVKPINEVVVDPVQ
ncbi:MAG: IgGFc-binding protein [bacterium]